MEGVERRGEEKAGETRSHKCQSLHLRAQVVESCAGYTRTWIRWRGKSTKATGRKWKRGRGVEAGVGAAGGRQLLFLIATESNGKNNNSAFNFIALSTLLGLA